TAALIWSSLISIGMSARLNSNTARGADTACQGKRRIEADDIEILITQRDGFYHNGALLCIEAGDRPFCWDCIDYIPGLDGDMIFIEQADNDVDGFKHKIFKSIFDPHQNTRTDEHPSFQDQISIFSPYW